MTKTHTLTCAAGHTWDRPAQRGRPPRFCPDHAPAKPERPASPAQDAKQRRLDALRAGREARAERLRAEAVQRVETYRGWLKTDAEVTRRRALGETVERPPVPEIPTDHDYDLSRP